MKKKWIGVVTFTLLMSFSLIGCASQTGNQIDHKGEQKEEEPKQTAETEEKVVRQLVSDFGQSLQKVSLLAPEEIVNKNMQENYGDFVTKPLLSKWMKDPQNAPGRMVSSPWPDRIVILSSEKISEGTYEVKGEIIEVTSKEKTEGGSAAKRPITLIVKLENDRWLINEVTVGPY